MKGSKKLLAVALILILLGSLLASMMHTSMYTVKVSDIRFETERGTLSGLLYMPKGADATDPRPVIVTTHGYLNSREMQDAPAVEMSRRGFIVLALDMYDHGHSRWKNDIKLGEEFGTFWIYSLLDAANYMATQDYTKKDETGNAYVSVSGHSMGGFSTIMALYMDEMAALQRGTRNIYAGIPVAADFSIAAMLGPQEAITAAFGSRTVGIVAAHYDEFFFIKSDAEKTEKEKSIKGSVYYKDFAATLSGKAFLGLSDKEGAAISDEFYTVSSGEVLYEGAPVRPSQEAKRIIYTPSETHPWNHFSKTTTAHLIDFYQTAFEGVTSPNQKNVDLDPNNQIWFLKELFNLMAMVGFFLLIGALVPFLLKLPILSHAISEEVPAVSAPKTKKEKTLFGVAIVFSVLYPAVFFGTLMDKQKGGLMVLAALSGLALLLGIFSLVRDASKKTSTLKGSILLVVVSALTTLLFLFAGNVLKMGPFFNEPTVNQIAFWAVSCGLIALIVLIIFFVFFKKNQGTDFRAYGVPFKLKPILASLLTACLTLVIAYGLLFLIQHFLKVDFRFWTLAVKTFDAPYVAVALRYLPFFFVYYFINAISLNANTRGMKRGLALSICLNVGGLVLWLLGQYGLLFLTGVAMLPAQSLNGILLVAVIPCLAIAAVYAKSFFKKTQNVWLSAFLNGMLFTMITCANTIMFWHMIP